MYVRTTTAVTPLENPAEYLVAVANGTEVIAVGDTVTLSKTGDTDEPNIKIVNKDGTTTITDLAARHGFDIENYTTDGTSLKLLKEFTARVKKWEHGYTTVIRENTYDRVSSVLPAQLSIPYSLNAHIDGTFETVIVNTDTNDKHELIVRDNFVNVSMHVPDGVTVTDVWELPLTEETQGELLLFLTDLNKL